MDGNRLIPAAEEPVRAAGLASVCREARCPNRKECYPRGEMTFLVLGTICTRGCPFCGITPGRPLPPDPDEPVRLAAMVRSAGLARVVITSVTRDDLADGGASHLAACHARIVEASPGTAVELLLPDFSGDSVALALAVAGRPAVAGHNIETVPRLHPSLRPGADYGRSLRVLSELAAHRLPVRSALMVGLGETAGEVLSVMSDLRRAGVTQLVVGQYLPPTRRHVRPASFVPPETFDVYRRAGYDSGFESVLAEPLARSSMEQRTGCAR